MKCIGCHRWIEDLPEMNIYFGRGEYLCASCLLKAIELLWEVYIQRHVGYDEEV